MFIGVTHISGRSGKIYRSYRYFGTELTVLSEFLIFQDGVVHTIGVNNISGLTDIFDRNYLYSGAEWFIFIEAKTDILGQ